MRPAVLALLVASVASAAEVPIRPAPSWVSPLPLPEPGAEPHSGPVRYLLVDEQVRFTAKTTERYAHYARKIASQSGLENNAEVEISFDPSFERLTLHAVDLIREGKRRSVLRNGDIRVIQQEQGLAEKQYRGTRTALVFVRDLRVGDTLEYAFTREGHNPVFEGKLMATFSAGWDEPVDHWRVRILHPTERKVGVKLHRAELAPKISELGHQREYVYEQRPLPKLELEGDLPNWEDPWPWIQVSEHQSWAEVAQWAARTYASVSTRSGEADQLAAKWRGLPTEEERFLAALRFVQDEIRYLGFELGPNTHQPHSPAEVLENRFGDCKDKALLLVTLLDKLGIRARSALVHTGAHQGISNWLPSPWSFDHVIVQAEVAGKQLWVDPTNTLQRGGTDQYLGTGYGKALLVAADQTELAEVPAVGYPDPTITIEESYDASAKGSPALLTVITRHRRGAANQARRRLSGSSAEELTRDYLKFYERSDSDVRSLGPIRIDDDPKTNTLTFTERYELPSFWEEGSRAFYGHGISAEVPQVEAERSARKLPYAVAHPVHVAHVVRVKLQQRSAEKPQARVISSAGMSFSTVRTVVGATVEHRMTYRSLADHVSAAAFEEHRKRLDEVRDALSFTVFDPTHETKAEPLAVLILAGVYFGLVALLLGGFALSWAVAGPRRGGG